MYIVDTGQSWLKHPFLYGQEGPVQSEAAIREIVKAGFVEAFIDPEKNASGAATAVVDTITAAAPAPKVPLHQELATASKLYTDCLSIARDVLRDVKAGNEIDIAPAESMVDDVIASALRNADALIALSKLRQHDAYTFTHGVNVSVLAVAFGGAMGFMPVDLKELGLAGLFHDVGKTGIPDPILNKPGRLTPKEFDLIKMHPALGRRLLAGRGLREAVLRGVAEHHEKFDGSGYPNGLAGEDVHPWGRILGVADIFDALTSRRAYKDAMLPTKALGVLYGMRGKAFPAGLIERFIKFLGPYPVGSFVRLTSGEYGFVRDSNPAQSLFPELLVVLDPNGHPVSPHRLVLTTGEAGNPSIVEAVDPQTYGLDPLENLLRPVA
jgi:HD-GYP domain-containing protein (c-di-GMP phosphodiesterase class II)